MKHGILNMNLDNFKSAWQQQSTDTHSAIEINQAKLAEIKINKQIKALNKMKWARILESVVFLIIIVLLWKYIAAGFTFSAPIISGFVLNLFAIIGLAGNIGQIVLISNIDYSKPVNQLQKDFYRVCSHKLELTKLLLMSVPFYLAYVFIGFDLLFGIDLYQYLELHMIWFYSLSSVLLFIATAWVFAKLNYKNISEKWVNASVQFIVGKRLVTMAEFLNSSELIES